MSPKRLLYAAALCVPLIAVHAGAQSASEPAVPAAASNEALVPAVVAALTPGAAAMSGPVRNVVLVHGAFVDGSSWNGVIAELQKKGYNVSAVQNPLTSLADDADAVRQVLARQTGPTLLVGHSWGGTVITEAGADAPNVVGLVYIAAIAPDIGESTSDVLKHGPTMPINASIAPDADGYLWLDPAKYHDDFAADVPETQTRVLSAGEQPIAAKAFSDPVTKAAWKSKPSWYMVATKDRAVSPDLEQWMAKRIGATVISIPSSHLAPVSHAVEVAVAIDLAAQNLNKP
ncbi:alpha/beta fold hydrolase [Paraburkholderia megapolitana]|uniref:alpha/beta fold hydrolase n=1 Tax=Paraburkholderia megapolitana TaxID=420953 RepID=UPI0038BCD9A8